MSSMKLNIDLMGESPIPVMTNSSYEFETNKPFFDNAKGNVLMIGLGIGYVLPYILPKIDSIDIVEIDKEVIDLAQIFHAVHNPKVKVIHADGLTYVPEKQYDTIWWDTFGISAEEEEKQLARLKQYLKPNGWIDRWRY